MFLLFRHLVLLGISCSMAGLCFPGERKRLPDTSLPHVRDEIVRIGILLPDRSDQQILQTARMAVDRFNSVEHSRHHFELVPRTTEGPWGAGSKESVALVYEDSVAVIVGSLDGRNAHLAEQVSAKSHLVYLETRATDPTLSQAFVPWFMRCVPGDDQQSETILERITEEGTGRIAILSVADYDTRYSVRSLVKTAAQRKAGSPLIIDLDPEKPDFQPVAEELGSHRISHLILPFWHPSMPAGLTEIRNLIPDLKIYGNLAFTLGMEADGYLDRAAGLPGREMEGLEGVAMVCSGARFSSAGRAFREQFRTRFGSDPGSLCSYMHDAIGLVIEAVVRQGATRDSMKDILAGIHYTGGMTGPISFDEWGNRQQEVPMMTIRSGTPELTGNANLHP